MASEELKLIEQHIKASKSFVLNGGAGSGKTRSLVDVINLLYESDAKCKMACITFTNVASDEITNRVAGKNINLRSSTIHDFLWDLIKSYQKNLKQILSKLIESGAINHSGDHNLTVDWYKDKTIEYREWRKLEEGIISHNEVLQLANALFEEFPLLGKILGDKYDVILIDEYQDTEEQIIEIFLDFIQESENRPIIGLFGDSMQSIYNKGVGDLQKYIDSGTIEEVQKSDNWRCAKSVIRLINKVRNDGLMQKAANNNVEGRVTFLFTNSEQVNIEQIKNHEIFNDFDFSIYDENKELYLTHKLIASQFGFENLLNNYTYKDNLTGDNPDRLAKHLFQIQEIIILYENANYNEFLKITDFKIQKNSDLEKLKEKIEVLKNHSGKTINQMIVLSDELGLVKKDDKLENYIIEHEEQFNSVKDLSYQEVANLFEYRNQHSPYSTQHGVKGAEFDNVFVILDNGKWNQYNFEYLLEDRDDKESIVNRSRKVFYVCCSRAKNNLVVLFQKPSTGVLEKAREWFGAENVIEVT